MFFLLPKVTVVLLVTFAILLAWRAMRQRRGRPETLSAGRLIGRWMGQRSGRRNRR